MNERIRELSKQAAEFIEENSVNWTPEEFEQKFAQLIVQECLAQVNKVEEKGDAHLGGGTFYDGTELCGNAIKEHFGVEL
jgi:hypothetical protein